MVGTYRLEVQNGDIVAALRCFLQRLLATAAVRAVLVPQHLPMKSMVMPTLVIEPDRLEGADPLAPCFPMNAAAHRLPPCPQTDGGQVGGRLAAL